VVDFLDEHLFSAVITPFCERLLAPVPWPLLREAFLDPDFGLLPTGLFLAFGLVMPVLAFFYFAFAVLQRSGYLARLTVLLDRLLRPIGLNGKAVLPLSMGLSCITMALITTRMLEKRRERLIASFLLLLGLPCAPLLAVMLVIFKELPLSAALLVFGVLVTQVVVAGVLANRVMKGRVSDFILELPPLRLPDPVGVISETAHGTWAFMREAVPLFLAASLALFVADELGALDLLERAAHPVTHGLLRLPDQAVQVFIKTLIRRENGATELMLVRGSFTHLQQVVTLLVMVGLTPCINAVLVLVKEQGLARAAALIGAVTTWTILLATVLMHLCLRLGITF
jgi:ferrous iron transport protein B